MNTKFHLLILMSCILFEAYVESNIVYSNCYPNVAQKCDKDSATLEWPENTMKFLLFTRKNPDDPERLHMCNGTLPKNSLFNPNNQLIVFVPGFMFGTCEINDIPEIKDELLKKGDFNVILIVDNEEYGNIFLTAMTNMEKAANLTVRVLQNIQAKTGIALEKVYLIGHSLGAHVSGLIGQQIPIHRITALDPAGVTYTKEFPLEKRLDSSDATLVDVIHTGAGTGLPYLGAYFRMGHADFYVNGGTSQPKCETPAWNKLMGFNFFYVVGTSTLPTVCAHAASIEYYKRSINNEKFVAYNCKSYKEFKTGNCTEKGASTAIMGFNFEDSFKPDRKNKKSMGKYYIDIEE